MKIYLNLRGKKWIIVEDVLEQVVISKGRKTLRYVLVGSSVNSPNLPVSKNTDGNKSLLVPAKIVNKLIMKLLNRKPKDLEVVLDYHDKEHYLLRTLRGDPSIILEILDELEGKDSVSK
ncbi:MAG: hypothetical protein QXP02_03220 [Desulfurococcaceae archaeon]